jgi:MFS family permease
VARRAAQYGAFPIVALAATVTLETGERGSLSQAADGIQAHFGVSDRWIGALPAALTIIGVVGSIPFGHLADRRRRTWLLAGAMGAWTLVMGFSALAPTFALLFITRLGVGIVEANGPASISLISDYYPAKDRAKRIGLYNAGGLLGSALGLGLAGVFVDQFGWRAAFWMWIPFGIVAVVLLLRLPEPRRGDQDADFGDDVSISDPSGLGGVDATELAGEGQLSLPPATRTSDIDYEHCDWRQAFREILRIRSMWFGVLGITVAQAPLAGLGFWAVPFFKEAYGLSGAEAGGYVVVFGLGAGVGVVSGGFVADRLLRRGIVNARVYVVAASSLIATVLMIPAFAASTLAVTVPLFLVGGFFLTLPLAPADAMLTDVVVAPLRGRAAALRAIVRSLAGLMPFVIGLLKELNDLRFALVAVTPIYAVGGLIVLLAARTYPADLAYVIEETRRIEAARPKPDTSVSKVGGSPP